MGIIVGILVLSFLVTTHEFGHFLMAKLFGVKVPEFSVGMGPRLFGRQIGDTAYNLRLVPIGGYCALEGEDAVSEDPAAFGNKPVLERILIVFGGPLFNILTALALSFVLVFNIGINSPVVYHVDDVVSHGLQNGDVITSINGTSIITGRDVSSYLLSNGLDGSVEVQYYRDGKLCTSTYETAYEVYRIGIQYSIESGKSAEVTVLDGSACYEAGMRTGDVITAVNGVPVTGGEMMSKVFDETGIDDGATVDITVNRNGEEKHFSVTPVLTTGNELGFSAATFRDKSAGIATKLRFSILEVQGWLKYTVASLKCIVSGGVKLSDLSGPVGIVDMVSDTVESDAVDLGIYEALMDVLNMVILLAVNIGVMNLLPIPALDGGRLVFLFIEAVSRKRVKPEIEATIHTVGLGLLLLLMGFIMIQDALRLMG